MTVSENISIIRSRIADAAALSGRRGTDILLVAAAKTNPASAVAEAISAGVDAIGENRVQEMLDKHGQGAYKGAPLHLIGHLQRNKVRNVVGVVDLIESADSAELLGMIDARAKLLGITQDVLLEINIGGELSKSGLEPHLLFPVLDTVASLEHIRVRGLMAIPPISSIKGENRPYFAQMYKLFVDIGAKKYDNVSMDFLSMGMSGDFEDAIAEGSNMVRIGSAIFGARSYPVCGGV